MISITAILTALALVLRAALPRPSGFPKPSVFRGAGGAYSGAGRAASAAPFLGPPAVQGFNRSRTHAGSAARTMRGPATWCGGRAMQRFDL